MTWDNSEASERAGLGSFHSLHFFFGESAFSQQVYTSKGETKIHIQCNLTLLPHKILV